MIVILVIASIVLQVISPTSLQVSTPVAALQCDIETTGTAQIISSLTTKQLTSNRLPDGKLRIVIFGLNQEIFTGAFATVDAPVQSISGVVLSDAAGTLVTGSIDMLITTSSLLPAPENVSIK